MPDLTQQQWDEVRRAYIESTEPVRAIAERFGVQRMAVQRQAKSQGWPSRRARSRAPAKRSLSATTIPVRRRLLRRLIRIIETELELMEKRMQTRVEELDKGNDVPAADHERDARAVGTLVRSLDKVTEIAADLDRTSGGKPKSANVDADADELFAEADRFRRELAERLSKFIPVSG
jgi:hypothetical protein